MQPSTLDGYLLRTILRPFLLGLLLLLVVTAFAQVLKVSDTVTGLGLGPADILHLLGYSLPPLLGVLLPISGLYATLIALGRLGHERELLALAQMGASPWLLLRVPTFFGGVLALLALWALVWGEPWGIEGIRTRMAEGTTRALIAGVSPGTFHSFMHDTTFFARDREQGDLVDILLADHRHPDRPIIVTAQRGALCHGDAPAELMVVLYHGEGLEEGPGPGDSHVVTFERGIWRFDVGDMVRRKLRHILDAQALPLHVLWAQSHDPSLSHDARALRRIMWHRKFALPCAGLIFTWLAVPLGASGRGGRRLVVLLAATALVACYYQLGRYLELSARAGALSPDYAAWLPNAVAMVLAVVLWWRFCTEPS